MPRRRTILATSLTLGLVFGGRVVPALAQHAADAPASDAAAPHGGQLARVFRHGFETVITPAGIRVYVYEAGGVARPARGLRGRATLHLADGGERTIALRAGATPAGETPVYYCPRHGAVFLPAPGPCARCGAPLAAQDGLIGALALTAAQVADLKVHVRIEGLPDPPRAAAFWRVVRGFDGTALAGEGTADSLAVPRPDGGGQPTEEAPQ
jgi:hypothetical protein